MGDVPATEAPSRIDRIVVLFTPELGKQVRDLAERERRSISTQIQMLVEHALACSDKVAAA